MLSMLMLFPKTLYNCSSQNCIYIIDPLWGSFRVSLFDSSVSVDELNPLTDLYFVGFRLVTKKWASAGNDLGHLRILLCLRFS